MAKAGGRMKYHYSHRRTMERHGIRICRECEGDGCVTVGRTPERLRDVPCPALCVDGWQREEAIGINWKRIRQHTEAA